MTRWRWALALLTLASQARASDELLEPAGPRPPEQRALHVPDHFALRSGGYLGLATLGLGLAAFQDHLNVTGYYGWVPRAVGGTDIHSLALLITGRASRLELGEVRWVPAYAGLGALYVRGDGFFVDLPDRYPGGYYPPTGIRALAVLGSELELGLDPGAALASHGLFVEIVALDVLLLDWTRNPRTLSLVDVFSTGVGYKARFP